MPANSNAYWNTIDPDDSEEELGVGRRNRKPSARQRMHDEQTKEENRHREEERSRKKAKAARRAPAAHHDSEDDDGNEAGGGRDRSRTRNRKRSIGSRGDEDEHQVTRSKPLKHQTDQHRDQRRGRSRSVTPIHQTYREFSPEAEDTIRPRLTHDGSGTPTRYRTPTSTFEGEDIDMNTMERPRKATTQERLQAHANDLYKRGSSPSTRSGIELISPEKVVNLHKKKRGHYESSPAHRGSSQTTSKRARTDHSGREPSSHTSQRDHCRRHSRTLSPAPRTSKRGLSRSSNSDVDDPKHVDEELSDNEKSRHDAVEPELTEAAKAKIAQSKGRYVPRRKDYPQAVREVIDEAYEDFKSRMVTQMMYPAQPEELDAEAAGSFLRAAIRQEKNFKVSANVIRIVRDSIGSYRSGLVNTFRSRVKAFYGFDDSPKTGSIEKNIDYARGLLEGDSFTFKIYYPKKPRYIFRSDIIQDLINELFFGDGKDSFGIRFAYFKPIPLPLVAFVCAGIEHCIKEWSDGTLTKTDFKTEPNRKALLRHLKNLNRLADESPKQAAYVAKMQEGWYKKARSFARLDDDHDHVVGTLIEHTHFQEQYHSSDEETDSFSNNGVDRHQDRSPQRRIFSPSKTGRYPRPPEVKPAQHSDTQVGNSTRATLSRGTDANLNNDEEDSQSD